MIAPKAEDAFNDWEAARANARAAAAAEAAASGRRGGGNGGGAAGAEESSLLSGPLQPFCVMTALLIWLWFDQECARMAEQVRGYRPPA